MNRRDAMALLAGLGAVMPLTSLRSASGDASSYGLRPDASPQTNTAALQKCLNDNPGRQVLIPGADAEYQLSGRVSAPAGTSIVLQSARLRWVATDPSGAAFLRAPTRCGIEVMGDNFRLTGKGQITGPSQGIYVGRETAIVCVGASATVPRRGFEVSDGIEICNWGSHGIAAQFVRDVRVANINVNNCGYAGMQFLSCQNGKVVGNVIGSIGPGTSGNAYGVSCNLDSLNYADDPQAAVNGRLVANPFCTDFEIGGNTVFDIPLWAGIDFHGAYECQAHDNKVYNCRHGVLLQGGSNAAVDFAGEHNSVTGNAVTTTRMNGDPTTITEAMRLGISVNGGKRIRHRSIVVRGNSIDGYGDSRNTSCSIQHTNTADAEIASNHITNWRGYACYSANSQGVIHGNEFGPVADGTSTACVFVAINGDLQIVGNRHVVPAGQGARYGLYINSPSDGPYVIQGNDFRSATVQQYAGARGARLSPSQISGGSP